MSNFQKQLKLCIPSPSDGASVFRLINQCPPLDTNSMYCNLLQCTHFAKTSVAAVQNNEAEKDLLGFISGYLKPENKNTLFIWQVAVDERARGIGLAGSMLKHLLDRPQCSHVKYLETTITESNRASSALFESLAKKSKTKLEKTTMFDRDKHLGISHGLALFKSYRL